MIEPLASTKQSTQRSVIQLTEQLDYPQSGPSNWPKKQPAKKIKGSSWYFPTVSPEHGAYVVLTVSFLTGAAAAQQWTWATTLALLCAFCGFQAEHPLMLQIKQRRSWKPRFLLWAGVYGGIAMAIAAFGVAMLKFGLIMWQKDGYCHAKIQYVALLETSTSLLFLAIAALSLLPPSLK